MKWQGAGVAVLLLVLMGVAVANAYEIAYEEFGYPAGLPLSGCSAGVGFSNTWYVGPGSDCAMGETGLVDPSGHLTVFGNALHHAGCDAKAKRDLTIPLGASGTTVYWSVLLRQDALGTFACQDHDWGGLILGGWDLVGTDGLYIGRGAYGDLSDKYVLGRASCGSCEVGSGVAVVVGQAALLVVRIDFRDGPDHATLYVDPIPGQPEPTGGTVFDDVDLGLFTQIVVTTGNNSVWTMDEIRGGSTWADVTPCNPPVSVVRTNWGRLKTLYR